jgi:hypothetical protein
LKAWKVPLKLVLRLPASLLQSSLTVLVSAVERLELKQRETFLELEIDTR